MTRKATDTNNWRRPIRRDLRVTCKVCGQPKGEFHRDAECESAWLAKVDAELAQSRKGTPS